MRYIFWCPLDSFVHVMLARCGWREESRVDGDWTVWVKMVAP